jgi:hypothetical protein
MAESRESCAAVAANSMWGDLSNILKSKRWWRFTMNTVYISIYIYTYIYCICRVVIGLFAGWMGIIPILETAINGKMDMGTLITPC